MLDYDFLKRLIDLTVATVLLVLLSPILLISLVLVIVTMGHPIFFAQLRSGKSGVPFRLFKIRTMSNRQTDKEAAHKRITRVGLILRRFSIDEIPQLINVLSGDMSLVGPRPLLIEYNNKYSKSQARRLLVKPGITGLAQISGRNALTWDEKLRLDVFYVDNCSFWLDLKIIFKTPYIILFGNGFKALGEKKFGE